MKKLILAAALLVAATPALACDVNLKGDWVAAINGYVRGAELGRACEFRVTDRLRGVCPALEDGEGALTLKGDIDLTDDCNLRGVILIRTEDDRLLGRCRISRGSLAGDLLVGYADCNRHGGFAFSAASVPPEAPDPVVEVPPTEAVPRIINLTCTDGVAVDDGGTP